MDKRTAHLLVTDLDDTLWNWFHAWYESFSAMLSALSEVTGIPAGELEPEIRAIHQKRGTVEYTNLLAEMPSLKSITQGMDPLKVYDEVLHIQNSTRKHSTRLYEGVADTLRTVHDAGVKIVAYTESLTYFTDKRIEWLGLDGIIDCVYSAPDHDLPHGKTFAQMRSLDPSAYGLKQTDHLHVRRGLTKPNPEILIEILQKYSVDPAAAVYVGDSLMKDVAMAQRVGVIDVHAKYGVEHQSKEYALLQRVTHWPDSDVNREQALETNQEVVPTYTLTTRYSELLDLFDFQPAGTNE